MHCFNLIAVQRDVYLTDFDLDDGSQIMGVSLESQQPVVRLLPEVTDEQNTGEFISIPLCKNSNFGFRSVFYSEIQRHSLSVRV